MEKTINQTFWEYLHTVHLYHDNQPNELNRQVIFKNDIPSLIKEICSIVNECLPKEDAKFYGMPEIDAENRGFNIAIEQMKLNLTTIFEEE